MARGERQTVKELPHALTTAPVARIQDPAVRQVLADLVRAIQANFDHLAGQQRLSARQFNELSDDLQTVANAVQGLLEA